MQVPKYTVIILKTMPIYLPFALLDGTSLIRKYVGKSSLVNLNLERKNLTGCLLRMPVANEGISSQNIIILATGILGGMVYPMFVGPNEQGNIFTSKSRWYSLRSHTR